jgi:hypothetical protein
MFRKKNVDNMINPIYYFFQLYGLSNRIQEFLYELIDIECILIIEIHHLNDLNFSPLEKKYFLEFKNTLKLFYE